MLIKQYFCFANQNICYPMSSLNKIKIKKYILPYLSTAKRGNNLSEEKRIDIIRAIFHRLKTGCQWRELPIERYFKDSYSY